MPQVALIGTNSWQSIVTDWPCSPNVIASATRAELMTGLSILAAAQMTLVSNQIKFTHLKNFCLLLQRSCNSMHTYFQIGHHKVFSQSGTFYKVSRKKLRTYEQINALAFSDFSQVCFLCIYCTLKALLFIGCVQLLQPEDTCRRPFCS